MICSTNCLNGGTCSFNDTCICRPCFMGTKCERNANVIEFSLTFAMQWDIRETSEDSHFNWPAFVYTTTIALMLFMAVLNTIASLQIFFTHDVRLSNCGIFQILYCFNGLFTLVGMQLRMLAMLKFDSLIQSYSYRYTACNIVPVAVIIMNDTCMWLSALLAIEFVLLECLNFNLYRSRKFSAISSSVCVLLISGSHLHAIIARRPLPDPYQPSFYTCTFIYSLPIDIIDKILRVCHVMIPCTIHFITSICILTSVTRRILLVYSRMDYFHVFIHECIKRKHFFIPPLFIILSNLPHLILHLKDTCEDARDTSLLRTHIAFNILVYLPPSMTFFIYIYPSKSYMHKFQQTFVGHWLKRVFHRKKEKRTSIPVID